MRRTHFARWTLIVALVLACVPASAQQPAPTRAADADPAYVSSGPVKCVEVGDYYFKRKKYAGALSRYEEAVKTDPYYAPGYLGLGKVYEKLGFKQKALANFQKYLDMLPSDKQAAEAKDVHKAIARLDHELGKEAKN